MKDLPKRDFGVSAATTGLEVIGFAGLFPTFTEASGTSIGSLEEYEKKKCIYIHGTVSVTSIHTNNIMCGKNTIGCER